MPDRQIANAEFVDDVWMEDELAYRVGERIVELLRLEPYGGLYETTHGLKSKAGLSRSILEAMGFTLEN